MTEKRITPAVVDEIMNETYVRSASCSFEAVFGQAYHVFVRSDGTSFVSMVAPQEWDMDRFRLTYICDVVQDAGGAWHQV